MTDLPEYIQDGGKPRKSSTKRWTIETIQNCVMIDGIRHLNHAAGLLEFLIARGTSIARRQLSSGTLDHPV
jgi:hypothetical protein